VTRKQNRPVTKGKKGGEGDKYGENRFSPVWTRKLLSSLKGVERVPVSERNVSDGHHVAEGLEGKKKIKLTTGRKNSQHMQGKG